MQRRHRQVLTITGWREHGANSGACSGRDFGATHMTKLSIIVPCYNCADTLDAAVDSIYRQTPVFPFDVTMVDDGSTDGTYRCMVHLATQYPTIKLLRHPSNLGGGAARNTAVSNSEGDLIFCLDSDDILGPDFLKNMTRFWQQKRSDGLGISRSIKFKDANITDVAYVTEFEGPGKVVRFESVLDSSACSLYSTFLMTRAAFSRMGGYPTAHGFDTQGMAFRFLGNGLTAYTCPDTIYYHRVLHHQSYFLREAGAGRAHWNWFKILQEFLYLFRDDVKATILDYDCFPTGPQPTLENALHVLHQHKDVFVENVRYFLQRGRDRVAAELQTSANKYEQYWVGTYFLSRRSYDKALDYLTAAVKSGFDHRMIYPELLEASMKLSGNATAVKLSLGDLTYYINDPLRVADSSAPPLSRYQVLENWLVREGALGIVGQLLKGARLWVRAFRKRGAKAPANSVLETGKLNRG